MGATLAGCSEGPAIEDGEEGTGRLLMPTEDMAKRGLFLGFLGSRRKKDGCRWVKKAGEPCVLLSTISMEGEETSRGYLSVKAIIITGAMEDSVAVQFDGTRSSEIPFYLVLK